MNYDPWRGVVSRNGIPGDELISGLQKSIRRGNADIAIDLAYEMYLSLIHIYCGRGSDCK